MSENESPKNASTALKAAWLREHLSYELQMLRHCRDAYSRLAKEQQLDWNAYYAAFAVYARNLYNFLRNKGDPDTDFNAVHFVRGGFGAGKIEKTKGPFDNLNAQVFHMGWDRPPTGKGEKVNVVQGCEDIYWWIERHMQEFVGKLDEPFKDAWAKSNAAQIAVAIPKKPGPLVVTSLTPSATNAPPTITTSSNVIVRRPFDRSR